MTKAEKLSNRIQRQGQAKQARFKALRAAIQPQPLSDKELLSIQHGKRTDNRKPKHNQMGKQRGLRTNVVYPHGEVRQYTRDEIAQANEALKRTDGKAGVSVGLPTQTPLSPSAPRIGRTTNRPCLAP